MLNEGAHIESNDFEHLFSGTARIDSDRMEWEHQPALSTLLERGSGHLWQRSQTESHYCALASKHLPEFQNRCRYCFVTYF